MIHVGMRDKGMTDFEKISGRQAIDVPKIKDQGAFLEQKGNKKAGITERTMD